jgi:hypothetical protein
MAQYWPSRERPHLGVLEHRFRRIFGAAWVAWGRSVSDGLAAGSPPSGLVGVPGSGGNLLVV